MPAEAEEVALVPQLTQGDLDDAFHIGWSSIRRTFHDAAAVARAHANQVSGGNDRVGAGSRRAFWRAFRKVQLDVAVGLLTLSGARRTQQRELRSPLGASTIRPHERPPVLYRYDAAAHEQPIQHAAGQLAVDRRRACFAFRRPLSPGLPVLGLSVLTGHCPLVLYSRVQRSIGPRISTLLALASLASRV